MKYSVNELCKKIKGLREELVYVDRLIKNYSIYTYSSGENVDEVKPDFNYDELLNKYKEINDKIVKYKHLINVHNITTKLDGYDFTIDEVLCYIPLISDLRDNLIRMGNIPERNRSTDSFRGMVEYTCTNYDPKIARKDGVDISNEISKILIALDCSNSVKSIEI